MSDLPPEVVPPAKPAPRRAVEEWARAKNIAPWLLRAAATVERWQIGPEFDPVMATEEEFAAAIAFAENPHAIANPRKG